MRGHQPKGLQQSNAPLWASAFICGKWGDGITHFNLPMSIYTPHSKKVSTIHRKENYFPFFEGTWKRGKATKVKSLRRMGQIEQERLYCVTFINIHQGFLSRAQAPRQELERLKVNSCCIIRSNQFHLFLRRNQVPSVPFQLNNYKSDHIKQACIHSRVF